MQFADIEMLDIPDDLSVTLTSQTASPSDSPKIPGENTASGEPKPKNYPSVQKWLAGAELPFQFDADAYEHSSKAADDFSAAQTAYITRLYKIVEDAEKVHQNTSNSDELEAYGPVGLVSGAGDTVASRSRLHLESRLNEAFTLIVEAYGQFHDQVAELLSDEDADAYADLAALLDCIHASEFSPIRQKPELIALWVNRYDPRPDNATVDAVMYDTPVPYLHPLFWAYITELVTRGMFVQAVESIRSSGYGELAETSPELHGAIEDLATVLDTYTSMALKGQFAEWKLTVCGYRDNWGREGRMKGKKENEKNEENENEGKMEDNKEEEEKDSDSDNANDKEGGDSAENEDKLAGKEKEDQSMDSPSSPALSSSSSNDPEPPNARQSPDLVLMASQVSDVWRVLSGLPKSIAAAVQTWYDVYAALALFQVRDTDVYDEYYSVAAAAKGVGPLAAEQAFSDVLQHRHMRVILAVDAYDSPTAAYVSRLYELKGLLKEYYQQPHDISDDGMDVDITASRQEAGRLPSSITLRTLSEYLLTRHAYECLEVHLLVPVAVGLLIGVVRSPGTHQVLAQFFPHYHCFTNDDMEWALTVCAKLGLSDTVRTLYIRQGVQSMRHGHLFEALSILAKCYDDLSAESLEAMQQVHHIAWEILFQDCLLNSAPVPDALVENVVTNNTDLDVNPVVQQCLAPYAVLAEYFRNLEKIQSGESGAQDASVMHVGESSGELFSRNISRLFHLLRFKYLPQKFAPLLLAQLLPFFSGARFALPDLIVVIELLDAFELQAKGEPDVDDLYEYAVENAPENAADWRNVLKAQGSVVPATVPLLVRDIRERIVASIGQVYVK